MNRGNGLILAFVTTFLAACATAGGGVGEVTDAGTGYRPKDTANTRSAGVHLAQAATAQGEQAQEHYEAALADALLAVQEDTLNPKAYLLAGQAAVGAGEWVQADTMLERAEELYPDYRGQIVSEREQGWVTAYNLGAQVMNEGDYDAAIDYFRGADILYDERPEAKLALAALSLRAGDTEAAATAYAEALEILSGPPPEGISDEQAAQWEADRVSTAINAGQLMAQTGRFAEAAELLAGFMAEHGASLDAATELQLLTARAGYLAQAGEAEQAEALYEEILEREGLTANEYFQIGIGFFNTGDFARAAQAFDRAAELNPYSRDALLNLVQSLYSQGAELEQAEATPERNQRLHEIYDNLLEAAEQVRAFDPLNRNLLSFMLRAYRAKADISPRAQAQQLQRRTQEVYREYQQQPYEISDISLSMRGGGERAEVSGRFTNLTGNPGESVRLQFSIVDSSGAVVRSTEVSVTTPAQNESVDFSATVDLQGVEFAGWKYEIGD